MLVARGMATDHSLKFPSSGPSLPESAPGLPVFSLAPEQEKLTLASAKGLAIEQGLFGSASMHLAPPAHKGHQRPRCPAGATYAPSAAAATASSLLISL